jgi:hypothetical protein
MVYIWFLLVDHNLTDWAVQNFVATFVAKGVPTHGNLGLSSWGIIS